MIKYEIQRPKQSVNGFIMMGYDFKTVRSSELQNHLKDGWKIVRKRYLIITSFIDWWNTLNNNEKISFYTAFLIPF